MGLLTPTDTLIESIISLLKQESTLYLFKLVLWLLNGRAAFKRQVASHSHFTPVHLPWRPELLAYLREQHAQNRRLVLATAADDSSRRSWRARSVCSIRSSLRTACATSRERPSLKQSSKQ